MKLGVALKDHELLRAYGRVIIHTETAQTNQQLQIPEISCGVLGYREHPSMLVNDNAQVGVDGHQSEGHPLLEKVLRVQLTKRAILAKLACVQVEEYVVYL